MSICIQIDSVCEKDREEEMMKNNSGWQIRYFRAMIHGKELP